MQALSQLGTILWRMTRAELPGRGCAQMGTTLGINATG